MKSTVFPGHVGEDHELAASLAAALEQGLASYDLVVSVFNTSDDRHRFPELNLTHVSGLPDLQQVTEYGTSLVEYLESTLSDAAAYLLMVTRSISKNSEWIAFETERSMQYDIPFIPCLADGLTWEDVVQESRKEHERTEIQQSRMILRFDLPWEIACQRVGGDVTSNEGMKRLISGLRKLYITRRTKK